MPSGPAHLLAKFAEFDEHGNMTDDGTYKAECIIRQDGGTVSARGIITIDLADDTPEIVIDAINYLVLEWDYAISEQYPTNQAQ